MLRKLFQNRKLKKHNSLDLIPVALVDFQKSESETIILLVKRFKSRYFNSLFHKSEFFQVKLDPMGSAVWLLIDGNKPIKEIVNQLEVLGHTSERLAERVVAFITELYRKDLINLEISKNLNRL